MNYYLTMDEDLIKLGVAFQCWFGYNMRRFSIYDWSIEQKWVMILLPLLILYNSESYPRPLHTAHWESTNRISLQIPYSR